MFLRTVSAPSPRRSVVEMLSAGSLRSILCVKLLIRSSVVVLDRVLACVLVLCCFWVRVGCSSGKAGLAEGVGSTEEVGLSATLSVSN